MYENNNVLVIIPARGGSKGIPRKNIRLLNEKPLISYAIEIGKNSKYADEIVVTTEDNEIASISKKFGASIIKRSNELAKDDIPLDPVIYDATLKKEQEQEKIYDIIITIQPTSPLLKTSTLDEAIEKFKNKNIDSIISVVDDRHLSWGYDEIKLEYFPLYTKRLNRQYLPKTFKETGSILATRRKFLTKNSRLGNKIDLIEVSKEESVDIDTYEDWWEAENYLKKKKIAIIVNAYDEIGTGHVYRCLSIASKIFFDEVLFILNSTHELGINIIKNYNYPFRTYSDYDDLFNILGEFSPQMIINDILDTTTEYMERLKEKNYFIINFEDLGTGSLKADLIFNALYENRSHQEHVYTGYEYYILKDEFYFLPSKKINPEVKNILITFGGTDPNNFTEKVLKSLLSINYQGKIDVILGLGYMNKEDFKSKYEEYTNIKIYTNVSNISEYMFKSDLIFTSAGRTMYEICSIGIPTICLCQNERELTHTFSKIENGFVNMGLGKDITHKDIIDIFLKISNDYEFRKLMNNRMKNIDLKHGFENIWTLVNLNYYKKHY